MTKAEVVLWVQLRALDATGQKFRRQHPVGPYVTDFAHVAGALVIEADGATHSSPEGVEHDRRRDAYLRARGWRILRVRNEDIYADVARVVEEIVRRLPPPSRPRRAGEPPPPLRGGG